MNPFEFYNPVKLIYGPGEVQRVGGEAARYDCQLCRSHLLR